MKVYNIGTWSSTRPGTDWFSYGVMSAVRGGILGYGRVYTLLSVPGAAQRKRCRGCREGPETRRGHCFSFHGTPPEPGKRVVTYRESGPLAESEPVSQGRDWQDSSASMFALAVAAVSTRSVSVAMTG